MEKKVIGINFKMEMSGRGIVNYDSSDQKYLLFKRNELSSNGTGSDKNFKLSKKVFTENGYKVKISQECLRHSIYQNEVDNFTTSIMYSPNILSNYIGSKAILTRGYMFAPTKESKQETLKRTSCLNITDAIQMFDPESSDDAKKTKLAIEMVTGADQSIVNIENVGDIKYDAIGSINLKEMSFISTDPLFDRLCVNDDWCQEGQYFDTVLKNNLGENYGKHGYFTNVNKIFTTKFGESGILLNDHVIVDLTKYLFKLLAQTEIKRTGSFAKVSSLKYQFIYDGFDSTFSDDKNWIEIKSSDDIESINFEPHHFYVECSEEDVTASKSELQQKIAELGILKEEAKAKAKEEKEAKKQAKEEKQ